MLPLNLILLYWNEKLYLIWKILISKLILTLGTREVLQTRMLLEIKLHKGNRVGGKNLHLQKGIIKKIDLKQVM
uniref:Uncharacterized protein n=1 Tax=Manihot esculenta TaxID=3983 RepID=A0A2C9WJ27_MANES